MLFKIKMNSFLSLPRLTAFRLFNARSLFRNDIDVSLLPGINIILGGNALGKTTLMQAIVYALTGGLNKNIEKLTEEQWGVEYFKKRFKVKGANNTANTIIEVDLTLGDEKISVRRGFVDAELLGFKRQQEDEWVENPAAQKLFESVLINAGYSTTDEFARLVHRLLYLSESRRSLAWDFDAQLRLMTLINQSYSFEKDLQDARKNLVELDTRHRHTKWGIKRLTVKIDKLREEESGINGEGEKGNTSVLDSDKDVETLSNYLDEIIKQRRQAEDKQKNISKRLSSVSQEIEELRAKIETVEGTLIAESIIKHESNNLLILDKMTTRGICPACGTNQPDLQATAQQYSHEHRCVLCGSETPSEENLELTSLRSQLNNKTQSQTALQDQYSAITNQVEKERETESEIFLKISEIRSKTSSLPLIVRDTFPLGESLSELEATRRNLKEQELEFRIELNELQKRLSRDYETFRNILDDEINHLKDLYKNYATEFLGIPCKLEEIKFAQKGANFTSFVPHFNNLARSRPEDCSEAQKFFLDIAFRMALIDLAATREKKLATFICETPENALDVVYIDNVVRMFESFAAKGHTVVMTSNIQEIGFASKVLRNVPKNEKPKRVLNLLDVGNMSDVQRKEKPTLDALVKKIIG